MIPDDPHERCWVPAEFTGPNDFDHVMVSLMAAERDLFQHLVGTGFIIMASPHAALVMTAAHNLEGIVRAQNPWPVSHPSALPEFTADATQSLSIDRRRLRAVYKRNGRVEFCVISEVSWVPRLDIALLTIHPQEAVGHDVFVEAVKIDTTIPNEGQEVMMFAYDKMEITNQSVDDDGNTTGQVVRTMALRKGVITAVHPNGIRDSNWPCFETSIPVTAGMSGGMFTLPGEGNDLITACGVVSRDISPPEADTSFFVAGCSTGAMLWPAMALEVSAARTAGEEASHVFLLEIVQNGGVQDVNAAGAHVRLTHHNGGRTTVTYSKALWRS